MALVLAVLVTACSSSRPDDRVATGPTPPDASEPAADGAAMDVDGPVVDARPVPGSEGPPDEGDGEAGPTPTSAPSTPTTSPRTQPLFSEDEASVGITDRAITLCGHAQIYLGRAFDVEPDDTQVFWRWLNDRGGIHGRRVEERIVEDGGGRLVAQAYEECRGSFVLRGGPTMDAVPSMREIVEVDPHRPLYLHFMARADASKRYSFSPYPTQEALGALFADLVLERHPGRKIGIVHRDSDGWMPGHDAFLARVRAAGATVVADIAQASGESVHAGTLARLREEGAEVVWAWVDAIASAQMIKEASAQRYGFRWVIGFPSNLLTDVLGDDALEPEPVAGISVWPPFTPGLRAGTFAGYAEELERFEAAFREYRGKPVPRKSADILFFKWLEDRMLAELFERCGEDCDRNGLVEVLSEDQWVAPPPACPLAFGGRNVGGHAANVVEAFSSSRGVAWRELAHCAAAG